MDDNKIIELFYLRSEDAIAQTAAKYGKYCHAIAYNILSSHEDSEECVNDTYLKVWNAIPPERPSKFAVYLGKITRNLSLDKFRRYNTDKRGAGQTLIALDEIGDCIPSSGRAELMVDDMALVEILNDFLASLNTTTRKAFMRRYWYFSSIKEIATEYGMSESKVKMMMLRARQELKAILEKEGILL